MAKGSVALRACPRVLKGTEQLRGGCDEGRADNQPRRLDVGEEPPDDGISAPSFQPAGGDALADDVGLLEEELLRRHRRAHDGVAVIRS